MDSVGERIRRIRVSKGVTQADLADLLDTTTATISRYEQSKRALRFAQAQSIADFLGVSVFELYGLPREQQEHIEQSQKLLSFIEKKMQRISECEQDEVTQKAKELLQPVIDEIEKELRIEVQCATIKHKAQVQEVLQAQANEAKISSSPPKIDLADKRRNKRADKLLSVFCSYPDDAQNRALDAVSTLGQLNTAGQKRAIGRIKELAELPRYQVQKESDTET